jgi:hypothetical protein
LLLFFFPQGCLGIFASQDGPFSVRERDVYSGLHHTYTAILCDTAVVKYKKSAHFVLICNRRRVVARERHIFAVQRLHARGILHSRFTMDERENHQEAGNAVVQRRGSVLSALQDAVFKKKRARVFVGLWLLGLTVMFVLPAPQTITDDMMSAYNMKMVVVEDYNGKVGEAMAELIEVQSAYNDERVRLARC